MQFRAQQGATSPTQIERTAFVAASGMGWTRFLAVPRLALLVPVGSMTTITIRQLLAWPVAPEVSPPRCPAMR